MTENVCVRTVDWLNKSMEKATALLIGACIGLILIAVLTGCARSHEDRMIDLQAACIRHHGSPVTEGGEFKECRYPWSVTIGKPK